MPTTARGGPLSFLAGIGDFFVGMDDPVSCFVLGGADCAKALASGDLPSQAYTNWVASQGIDTADNSAFSSGQVGAGVLPLGAGGISAAASAADEAAAAAEEGVAASDGVSLSLRYKAGWSPEQVAAADSKVAALNAAAQRGELVVSQVERAGTSAASVFRSADGEIPPGMDVDHMIDLQLGGADDVANMSPLDLSVNRSLGAQIGAQLRAVPAGTCVIGVQIC